MQGASEERWRLVKATDARISVCRSQAGGKNAHRQVELSRVSCVSA